MPPKTETETKILLIIRLYFIAPMYYILFQYFDEDYFIENVQDY